MREEIHALSMRTLTPEEITMNTWIADHYAERAAAYRKGLKPVG